MVLPELAAAVLLVAAVYHSQDNLLARAVVLYSEQFLEQPAPSEAAPVAVAPLVVVEHPVVA